MPQHCQLKVESFLLFPQRHARNAREGDLLLRPFSPAKFGVEWRTRRKGDAAQEDGRKVGVSEGGSNCPDRHSLLMDLMNDGMRESRSVRRGIQRTFSPSC